MTTFGPPKKQPSRQNAKGNGRGGQTAAPKTAATQVQRKAPGQTGPIRANPGAGASKADSTSEIRAGQAAGQAASALGQIPEERMSDLRLRDDTPIPRPRPVAEISNPYAAAKPSNQNRERQQRGPRGVEQVQTARQAPKAKVGKQDTEAVAGISHHSSAQGKPLTSGPPKDSCKQVSRESSSSSAGPAKKRQRALNRNYDKPWQANGKKQNSRKPEVSSGAKAQQTTKPASPSGTGKQPQTRYKGAAPQADPLAMNPLPAEKQSSDRFSGEKIHFSQDYANNGPGKSPATSTLPRSTNPVGVLGSSSAITTCVSTSARGETTVTPMMSGAKPARSAQQAATEEVTMPVNSCQPAVLAPAAPPMKPVLVALPTSRRAAPMLAEPPTAISTFLSQTRKMTMAPGERGPEDRGTTPACGYLLTTCAKEAVPSVHAVGQSYESCLLVCANQKVATAASVKTSTTVQRTAVRDLRTKVSLESDATKTSAESLTSSQESQSRASVNSPTESILSSPEVPRPRYYNMQKPGCNDMSDDSLASSSASNAQQETSYVDSSESSDAVDEKPQQELAKTMAVFRKRMSETSARTLGASLSKTGRKPTNLDETAAISDLFIQKIDGCQEAEEESIVKQDLIVASNALHAHTSRHVHKILNQAPQILRKAPRPDVHQLLRMPLEPWPWEEEPSPPRTPMAMPIKSNLRLYLSQPEPAESDKPVVPIEAMESVALEESWSQEDAAFADFRPSESPLDSPAQKVWEVPNLNTDPLADSLDSQGFRPADPNEVTPPLRNLDPVLWSPPTEPESSADVTPKETMRHNTLFTQTLRPGMTLKDILQASRQQPKPIPAVSKTAPVPFGEPITKSGNGMESTIDRLSAVSNKLKTIRGPAEGRCSVSSSMQSTKTRQSEGRQTAELGVQCDLQENGLLVSLVESFRFDSCESDDGSADTGSDNSRDERYRPDMSPEGPIDGNQKNDPAQLCRTKVQAGRTKRFQGRNQPQMELTGMETIDLGNRPRFNEIIAPEDFASDSSTVYASYNSAQGRPEDNEEDDNSASSRTKEDCADLNNSEHEEPKEGQDDLLEEYDLPENFVPTDPRLGHYDRKVLPPKGKAILIDLEAKPKTDAVTKHIKNFERVMGVGGAGKRSRLVQQEFWFDPSLHALDLADTVALRHMRRDGQILHKVSFDLDEAMQAEMEKLAQLMKEERKKPKLDYLYTRRQAKENQAKKDAILAMTTGPAQDLLLKNSLSTSLAKVKLQVDVEEERPQTAKYQKKSPPSILTGTRDLKKSHEEVLEEVEVGLQEERLINPDLFNKEDLDAYDACDPNDNESDARQHRLWTAYNAYFNVRDKRKAQTKTTRYLGETDERNAAMEEVFAKIKDTLVAINQKSLRAKRQAEEATNANDAKEDPAEAKADVEMGPTKAPGGEKADETDSGEEAKKNPAEVKQDEEIAPSEVSGLEEAISESQEDDSAELPAPEQAEGEYEENDPTKGDPSKKDGHDDAHEEAVESVVLEVIQVDDCGPEDVDMVLDEVTGQCEEDVLKADDGKEREPTQGDPSKEDGHDDAHEEAIASNELEVIQVDDCGPEDVDIVLDEVTGQCGEDVLKADDAKAEGEPVKAETGDQGEETAPAVEACGMNHDESSPIGDDGQQENPAELRIQNAELPVADEGVDVSVDKVEVQEFHEAQSNSEPEEAQEESCDEATPRESGEEEAKEKNCGEVLSHAIGEVEEKEEKINQNEVDTSEQVPDGLGEQGQQDSETEQLPDPPVQAKENKDGSELEILHQPHGDEKESMPGEADQVECKDPESADMDTQNYSAEVVEGSVRRK